MSHIVLIVALHVLCPCIRPPACFSWCEWRCSHWLYSVKGAVHHEGSEKRVTIPKNSKLCVSLLSVIPYWTFAYYSGVVPRLVYR